MDPSSLISQSAMPEMWQFPMVGVSSAVRATAAGLGHRDASAGESTVTEQSAGNRSRKKRRDSGQQAPAANALSEEDSSKFVSTSSGGIDLVFNLMTSFIAAALVYVYRLSVFLRDNDFWKSKLYSPVVGIIAH
ncbi:hypothetical protein IEQ34_012173 [Dendrobium chrysotoxum]|uniref:CASP-like protein n=1 Tax=Dendrobium chrysotoxum TaxID=161865 RepID=A0AAV7GC55_DENCH|nr:hypothetical protein IEQ34_012173 [Dendrobium chrysotoxum]